MEILSYYALASTIIVISLQANPPLLKKEDCKFTKLDDGTKVVNCTNVRHSIDKYLNFDNDTEVIDLSGNYIVFLSDETFKLLTSLVKLIMRNMTMGELPGWQFQMFATSYSIKYMDIANFTPEYFLAQMEFAYPPCIETLIADDLNLADLYVGYLKNLKTVSIQRNKNLGYFPIFHESAPIKEVFARGTPFEDLTVDHLCSHCKLKILDIDEDLYKKSEQHCNCSLVAKWMTTYEIRSTKPLKCPPPGQTKCDLKFTPSQKQAYDYCVLKMTTKEENKIRLLGRHKKLTTFIILFFIVSLFVPIYFCVKKIKADRKIAALEKKSNESGIEDED